MFYSQISSLGRPARMLRSVKNLMFSRILLLALFSTQSNCIANPLSQNNLDCILAENGSTNSKAHAQKNMNSRTPARSTIDSKPSRHSNIDSQTQTDSIIDSKPPAHSKMASKPKAESAIDSKFPAHEIIDSKSRSIQIYSEDFLPHTMLWAWERPENLKFINPKKEGVAFFLRRFRLTGDDLIVIPRSQILRLAPETKTIAVARIDISAQSPPSLSTQQREKLAKQLLKLTSLPQIKGLQIDFDARLTERKFYEQLLSDLRSSLPPGYFLSMTALASWGISDNWINKLPVDEIVVMLFDMGAETESIQRLAQQGNPFTIPPDKLSLGFSSRQVNLAQILKKSSPRLLRTCQRVYIFSPKSWTRDIYLGAISGVNE